MEHTKGPWHVTGIETPIYGSDGSLVDRGRGIASESTYVATVGRCHRAAERDANAALIAAAPDLLSASEALEAAISGTTDQFNPELRALRAAIAKARGDK